LVKENISPNEEKKIKKVSHELLSKLKTEKLVIDWRKKPRTKADVEVTIEKYLFDELPESYDEDLCKRKTTEVYYHVYDNYVGEGVSVYN
jgi:type I restriction enzyme R subunit